MKTFILLTFLSQLLLSVMYAQTAITGVYTDFGGFWHSKAGSISSTQPNNSHHLLGFTSNGTTYSTGVSDNTLTTNGVSFNPQVFYSMPATITGTVQYFGVGPYYGGFCNISPVPITSNKSALMVDGIHGLDLGTAIFNTSSNSFYTVASIEPSAIGDGIPDIIVTQVGDPSTTLDNFRFLNASNNTVGNVINVNFSTVTYIANCEWKFYNSSAQYVSGSPNTANCVNNTRQLRMIAFDFADFGITASNYSSITQLRHTLSGSSDQAFVAYNQTSIILLPITLSKFEVLKNGSIAEINWATETEKNNDYFTIERSIDGKEWSFLEKIKGAGNSLKPISYSAFDKSPLNGTSYYRLVQTDFDGNQTTSPIATITFDGAKGRLYPNPATDFLTLETNSITDLRLFHVSGKELTSNITIVKEDKNKLLIDVSMLNKGFYILKNGENAYPIEISK
ncbi:MAG: T9SS type A sorting domain-containing protein [Crocinitomicaceae bacterium]|nr:T9SS type A sorting domain-containing protein [Crocinitomicaceae bacterium]